MDVLRVVQSITKNCVEFHCVGRARIQKQLARVFWRRFREEERMSELQIDRAKKDKAQKNPRAKFEDQEGSYRLFLSVVELKRDEGENLRPEHADREGQASKFVGVSEVDAPAEILSKKVLVYE